MNNFCHVLESDRQANATSQRCDTNEDSNQLLLTKSTDNCLISQEKSEVNVFIYLLK